MRESLAPYKGVNRLNFLCILATQMLGEASLAKLPHLLTAFDSVLDTLPADTAHAIRNLRRSRIAPTTRRELVLMVDDYHTRHRRLDFQRARNEEVAKGEIEQRFVIDDNLHVRPAWTHITPPDVLDAIASLTSVLADRPSQTMPVQNATVAAEVAEEGDKPYQGLVQPLGFVPADIPKYDIARRGSSPGRVAWNDLVAVADRFDNQDVSDGRQEPGQRSWHSRLYDAAGQQSVILQQVHERGLIDATDLDLSGLKHLIGLPGAGKTTVLYLLAGHLAGHGKRACFLFPSIEVASGFIEVLQRYGVTTALLSGQSEKSKRAHAMNFSASLQSKNRGFGETRTTAGFFATNCALAGFASNEEQPFPHDTPPCTSLLQKERPQKPAIGHICALASCCGYQYSERQLGSASIWAGHVLSLDRGTSPIFCDLKVRHFEYLAKTFDLLVIDECDGAQTNLDDRGTPILKLAGASESLWSSLLSDLHGPAARGKNAFVAGSSMPALIEMTGRFGRATDRFFSRVMHFPKDFQEANSKILLTSLSIIADMYEIDLNANDEETEAHYRCRQGLERIWDAAAKVVAFRLQEAGLQGHDGDQEMPTDLERLVEEAADLMGASQLDVRIFYGDVLAAIEVWERDGNDSAVMALSAVLMRAPNLSSGHPLPIFACYCGLLVSVTLLVMQHFGLAPHLRRLTNDGLVSDGVFTSNPSRDQLAILPESLVGKLSGVRYTISEEGNVDIAHVSFAGTPRLLPHRMMALARECGSDLSVLLTSATSMLEDSPSFHIQHGPHYVLRRPNSGTGWKESRYVFLPKRNPYDAQAPLRFSGSIYSRRDGVLKSMVDQLLKDKSLSDVETAIATNDVRDSTPRKAAFIVNSYEQCELVFQHIKDNYPEWRSRVRYLQRGSLFGTRDTNVLTAAEVETLGGDKGWDLLIFPMNAIGRGVNIVFGSGPRQGQAMLGSLYFLTRPHPRGDSLQLIQGLVARQSELFDQQSFSSAAEALAALKVARREATSVVEHLLRMPLQVNRLGKLARPFVANQMIIILQTIGRAMRGDCPAFVYFVDAAWAPLSAKGMEDNERSSMLVMMQQILADCLTHPLASRRQCYQTLYESFSGPLNKIENLRRQ